MTVPSPSAKCNSSGLPRKPPPVKLFIILRACEYCLSSVFTSCTEVPLPLAPLRTPYFDSPFVSVARCADGSRFWANYPQPCRNGEIVQGVPFRSLARALVADG